jgi:hypothetical protein
MIYSREKRKIEASSRLGIAHAAGRPVRVQGMRWEGPRLGPQRAGLDPPGARGARPGWCRDRLCLREQGLLAHRHRHQRERPRLQPRRPADRPAAEAAAGLWRPRRILRLCHQAAGLGDGGTLARPRLAIAHRPSARPGGAADPCERSEAISHASWLADRDCFVTFGSSQ